MMKLEEAKEKLIRTVERFAPMTDELMDAIDTVRAESKAA